MQEERIVSTVIGHIYEASYNSSLWPIALESIANYTHSSSAALLYQDNELERAGDAYTYNISEETSARHKAYGIDPNFQIMLENVPPGTAAAIDHIIEDRNKLEDIYGEEFKNILVDADMHYLGGAILFMDEVRTAAIGLQRTKSMGGWTKRQIDKLNILIPHLQRALNIQKEFTRLETSEHALHQGLDRLMMGLVLFDKKLKPIYINPVARSVFKYHPAIHMKNDMIYAHHQAQTKAIHSALISAISSNQSTGAVKASTALGLKHPDYVTTLPVVISQVHGVLHGFEGEGGQAHAVMCFSDPDKMFPIESEKLVAIYGLTPVEAQVAISVANGMSPAEVAEMKKVAISTIRSQLKAIYRKLGVSSQAELVKVLLTGPFGHAV